MTTEQDENAGPGPLAAFELAVEDEFDPRPIARRLVEDCEEFAELRQGEPLIMFLFRAMPKEKNGRPVLGELALPRFQGSLGAVASWLLAIACQGAVPDYLMVLDRQWWEAAEPYQRAALLHHELMHAKHATDKEGELKFTDAGLPIWALRGHDIEEFNETVRRYGRWLPDITAFINAARGSNEIEPEPPSSPRGARRGAVRAKQRGG